MKYTKNIGLKLRALGFEFLYDNSNHGDDPDLQYEVYFKGKIEVTVEHSPGKVVIIDIESKDNVNCATLARLKTLDTIINNN